MMGIRKLDLSNNRLMNDIPEIILKQTDLKELHINNINLKSLPNNISALKELTCLKAGKNPLENLAAQIDKLKNIIELDISGSYYSNPYQDEDEDEDEANPIETLNWDLTPLESLKTLNISGLKLEKIPLGLTELKQLEVLDITNNMITELPIDIVLLPKLKQINLEMNRLEFPPQDVINNGLAAMKKFCLSLCNDDTESLDINSMFYEMNIINDEVFRIGNEYYQIKDSWKDIRNSVLENNKITLYEFVNNASQSNLDINDSLKLLGYILKTGCSEVSIKTLDNKDGITPPIGKTDVRDIPDIIRVYYRADPKFVESLIQDLKNVMGVVIVKFHKNKYLIAYDSQKAIIERKKCFEYGQVYNVIKTQQKEWKSVMGLIQSMIGKYEDRIVEELIPCFNKCKNPGGISNQCYYDRRKIESYWHKPTIQCNNEPKRIEMWRFKDNTLEHVRYAQKENRIKIFISYAHKDFIIRKSLGNNHDFESLDLDNLTSEQRKSLKFEVDLIEELDSMLTDELFDLQDDKVIEVAWDETFIYPGDQFDKKIKNVIEDSKIAILLLSPYYFKSSYIMGKELLYIRERNKNKKIKIIPVCYDGFDDYKSDLPEYLKGRDHSEIIESLKTCSIEERKETFKRICDAIRRSINKIIDIETGKYNKGEN